MCSSARRALTCTACTTSCCWCCHGAPRGRWRAGSTVEASHYQPGSGSPDVASIYVDWLASYLQHLSTLKERFDARVVVPLCRTRTCTRNWLSALPSDPRWHPSPTWPHSSLPTGVTGGCCCRGGLSARGSSAPRACMTCVVC